MLLAFHSGGILTVPVGKLTESVFRLLAPNKALSSLNVCSSFITLLYYSTFLYC